ncbi:MAG: hypothetical protein AB7H66_14230 [Hyphomonadaceae bacterium]
MPALNAAVFKLNKKFDPTNLSATVGDADLFKEGKRLQASFVFPDDAQLRRVLQRYLDALPNGVHEALRAIMHGALTADTPTPMVFNWEAAYDFGLDITQTPDTVMTPGVITVTLRGRYPDDDHPLEDDMEEFARSRSKAKTSGKRSKPAKRKASKKS